MITLGVVKERAALETRVAITPDVVLGIIKDRLADVCIEKDAGLLAGFLDQDYLAAGARIIVSRDELMQASNVVVAINGEEFEPSSCVDKTIVSLFDPYHHRDRMKAFCQANATVVSLELVPRISRAQSMDVLSSQANIAGYVAVLFGANNLSKVMPLMMTAAGTIKPAKVLVLGAGVAGLAAIATAKRLGAVVFAYDVRAVVKEQIESLGGKFVDIKLAEAAEGAGGYAKALSTDSQAELREKLAHVAKEMDLVITTAQIPGKTAPQLLDERVYDLMNHDAVFIDMASSSGGNVSGSKSNEWVRKGRVKVYGGDTMARMVPKDASFTFGKNIRSMLELMVANETIDLNDDILKDAVLCHKGAFINRAFKTVIES